MNILLACQKSGLLRQLLRDAGHDAFTCDIEPAEDGSHFHVQADAVRLAYSPEKFAHLPWDCMIAMPECRDLCGSGLHWNNRGRRGMTPAEAWNATERAYLFATDLKNAPIEHILIENSIGILSTRWGKPTQIVQPWMFGDDASKGTCLWMKNFPRLIIDPAKFIAPRIVVSNGKEYKRWANQTDSGQNRLGPSPTRSADRARTFPGIARAFADAISHIRKEI